MCLGEHVIKTYCKQQKVIALSSAEAELYAMVAASAETLALQAYAHDLGLDFGCELYCDSAAALGIAQRAGIGKVRHLRTQGLWVQEVRVSGRISYKKVLGEKNPADLLTKHMSADLSARHLTCLNMDITGGRANAAPTLDSIVQAWYEGKDTRESRHPRFSNKVSYHAVPAIGRQRPTPVRGTKISRTEEVDINNVENENGYEHAFTDSHDHAFIGPVDIVDRQEVLFGDGANGVGLLTRGARWADAGDDSPRTHACALDAGGHSSRQSADRQQEIPLLSLECAAEADRIPSDGKTQSTEEVDNWNRPKVPKEKKVLDVPGGTVSRRVVCSRFRAHSSKSSCHSAPAVERLQKNVSSEPFRPDSVHSNGYSFNNTGSSHNWGTSSVVGMRRTSGRTCLSPSLCRHCVQPNSCCIESYHSFSFAPATLRASVAGGAQTYGRTHAYIHGHVHSTCIGARTEHACNIVSYVS